MQRSISTVLITLLLAAATVPTATAQMQKPSFPVGASIGSATIAEQPASDSSNQAPTKTDVLPEQPQSIVPIVKAPGSEQSHPGADRSYPGYCPSLPPGTKPGDWEYRQALEQCLYGS